MYMHLHIPLSSHDSLPPSLRRRAGRNGQQSSAVLCEEFRSEKINISRACWNIAFRGRVVEGLYCTLILTLMSLISWVVHVV